MAHAHDHHHHGESYYLDQLCTILACGLLGGIAFLVWQTDLLARYNILADQFKRPVLFGGLALVVVAGIRGVALWSEVGKNRAAHSHDHHHDHDHHHHHDHDHDHGTCDHHHGPGAACDHHHHDHHHGHDHPYMLDPARDHGHDHGFAPWRYAVLLVPLMLSGLLLYFHYQGVELQYSLDRIAGGREQELEDVGPGVGATGEEMVNLGFQELTLKAPNPAEHGFYQGKVGTLRGMYNPISDKQFSLMRLKMTCCGADAVPLKVRILTTEALPFVKGDGVEVKGVIEFHKLPSGEYTPVLRTRGPDDVKKVKLGQDLYEK